jgi:hypothetical protein
LVARAVDTYHVVNHKEENLHVLNGKETSMTWKMNNTDLVEEVESITGIVFEDLTVREIKGALRVISMVNAGGDPDSAMGEHLIMDGDYEDGKGPLPEPEGGAAL